MLLILRWKEWLQTSLYLNKMDWKKKDNLFFETRFSLKRFSKKFKNQINNAIFQVYNQNKCNRLLHKYQRILLQEYQRTFEFSPQRRDSTPYWPFVLLWDIHIWWWTLKIVYRRLLILRGERAPKKNAIFWSKILQKVPKNAFWPVFLQNFACDAETLTKTESFLVICDLGELGKSIWSN